MNNQISLGAPTTTVVVQLPRPRRLRPKHYAAVLLGIPVLAAAGAVSVLLSLDYLPQSQHLRAVAAVFALTSMVSVGSAMNTDGAARATAQAILGLIGFGAALAVPDNAVWLSVCATANIAAAFLSRHGLPTLGALPLGLAWFYAWLAAAVLLL